MSKIEAGYVHRSHDKENGNVTFAKSGGSKSVPKRIVCKFSNEILLYGYFLFSDALTIFVE
ncbi:hypothetical protein [Sinanaerobacter chloroacetimidivorans]|uniref:hypothetical protein n=1 Tax=Sinanaerobacter chloroacetimidivorans TaxID=2818044 RepID=UPI001D041411|nr:hypothetical protein [Sinanaerobacter chloroacetimidivorans]